MKGTTLVFLTIIFLFAYAIRVLYLPQNALTFGYDQARDHLQAQAIINGDLKILGPPASTSGMHHGVAWFYFLVPPAFISNGSPIVSAYWNALFNAAVVFVVFALAYSMTKRRSAGVFAAFLYAISFESTQYAVWLSNPTLGAWTVPLMYLGLWLWISNKTAGSHKSLRSLRMTILGAVVTGLGLGLSVHANVFLLYHFIPLALWLWIARAKVNKKQLLTFLVTLAFILSPMIISEVKFGFKSISGVFSLLSSQDAVIASKKLGDFILLFFNQLGQVYSFNSYPGNVGYGGVFVLVLISFSIYQWGKRKNTSQKVGWQPFLTTWLLSHIVVVSVGGASTPFLLVGIGAAVSILLGIYISDWWRSNKLLTGVVLALLTFGNLNMITKENPKGQTIFAIQKDMLLSKQMKAIDYTYEKAEGEMFSTNALTSPLEINIVWSYLYKWYGENTYGYSPQWHGGDQTGQLDKLNYIDPKTDKFFLILEPMGGIPTKFLEAKILEENENSDFVEEKNWGELRVQERRRIVSD